MTGVLRGTPGRSIAERARAPRDIDLPSPHLQLDWRSLEPDDITQMTGLIRETEEAEGATVDSIEDVLVDLVAGQVADVETLGGFDLAGVLRAYAGVQLWPQSEVANVVLYGGVDPTWTGRGIGRSLLAWQEGRARQILAGVDGDGRARMSAYIEESAAERRRLYVAAGFSAHRWYTRMRRDLAAPIPDLALECGFVIKRTDQVDEDLVRRAHNEASLNAWGGGPFTPEMWHPRWVSYSPEWSHIVVDGEVVVGYALSTHEVQTWSPQRRTEGFIHRLGVVPAYRGRGVGRALGALALRSFAASGLRFASALVDPERVHGGLAMYDALGFAPTTRALVYTVEL